MFPILYYLSPFLSYHSPLFVISMFSLSHYFYISCLYISILYCISHSIRLFSLPTRMYSLSFSLCLSSLPFSYLTFLLVLISHISSFAFSLSHTSSIYISLSYICISHRSLYIYFLYTLTLYYVYIFFHTSPLLSLSSLALISYLLLSFSSLALLFSILAHSLSNLSTPSLCHALRIFLPLSFFHYISLSIYLTSTLLPSLYRINYSNNNNNKKYKTNINNTQTFLNKKICIIILGK